MWKEIRIEILESYIWYRNENIELILLTDVYDTKLYFLYILEQRRYPLVKNIMVVEILKSVMNWQSKNNE